MIGQADPVRTRRSVSPPCHRASGSAASDKGIPAERSPRTWARALVQGSTRSGSGGTSLRVFAVIRQAVVSAVRTTESGKSTRAPGPQGSAAAAAARNIHAAT